MRAPLPVSRDKVNLLAERMRALGVREQDIDEQFVRSSGAGGQNVNKVASCVILYHRRSGIRVKCQQERSQGLNRFLARRILLDKLAAKINAAKSAEVQRIEKIRRQKRKRSHRAKRQMLDAKHRHGEKKRLRSVVHPDSGDY
jgi:peptide chain release factor